MIQEGTVEIQVIERQKLSERVYDQIHKNIVSGKWKEGEKLPSEGQLCKLFNVSRVSVRSALEALRAQKLIITNQGMGSFVTTPTSKIVSAGLSSSMNVTRDQFVELQEFRQALEFKTVELAASRATEEDFNEMEEVLSRMEQSRTDPKRYSQADFDFHLKIAKASKNRLLYATMLSFEADLKALFENIHAFNRNRAFSLQNHRNILNALRAHDARLARSFITSSFKYNMARYSDDFRQEDA